MDPLIEMEGKENTETAIPKSCELLRKAFKTWVFCKGKAIEISKDL